MRSLIPGPWVRPRCRQPISCWRAPICRADNECSVYRRIGHAASYVTCRMHMPNNHAGGLQRPFNAKQTGMTGLGEDLARTIVHIDID
eukprot:365656-Chlamydomonas_euryale.AAC.2